jgi:serine/threonine protein kinase
MKITEEDGTKKAKCPKCGLVTPVASGEAGLSRRKVGRSPTGPSTGETTIITTGRPPATGKPDATPVPHVPLHDLPTRTDTAAATPRELTDFLAPAEAADEIGRLGGYRVLRVLGAGGMGVVFLAEEVALGRLVAVKAMLPALAASAVNRDRFRREARAIAQIVHDHIVTIYHVNEDRGIPFLVMPYLQGESLEARARRDPVFSVSEICRIGRETAEGLAAIHERGLIHRDIKPANIWLEAPVQRVKILDFGLARAARGEQQLTQAGAIVGSPAFMAPEQAGSAPVDARCDLFSLGCVLYLLSTGALPFVGADALSTLLAVTTSTPAPPHELNPAIPAALSDLIVRLLAKRPDDRPATARAVSEAIRAIEEQTTT